MKRRIDDIAADIEEKVIAKIKQSPFFSIQLDEFAEVAKISQLLVYSRYMHGKSIEEFVLSAHSFFYSDNFFPLTLSIHVNHS